MGFKPPADVGAVTGNAWFFVAIPDDPAYRTAAWGHYMRLADVWHWGLEEIDPDADEIRQQWLKAIDETLEAHEMGFPTTLLGYIDEIEDLLKGLQALGGGCCPDNTTYFTGDKIGNPDSLSYDGTPPGTWGDGETVADSDDWHDILCGAAHTYVDYLSSVGANLDQQISTGVLVVGAVVAILSALASGGLVLLIEIGLAYSIFQLIAENWTIDLFSDASAAIESARDDIVCAFLSGDYTVLEDAIEAEISATAWNTLFKWIDYESAINAAYYGEFEGQYQDVRRGETCDCTPDPEASGLYWNAEGSTTIPDYTTGSNYDGQELYYYQEYKLERLQSRLDFSFVDGVDDDQMVNCTFTQIQRSTSGSPCTDDPAMQLYDLSTIFESVSIANHEAFSGQVRDVHRIFTSCCSKTAGDGFVRLWFEPYTA